MAGYVTKTATAVGVVAVDVAADNDHGVGVGVSGNDNGEGEGEGPDPSLVDLPFDVHFQMATHLGYEDVLNLKKTCRYFNAHLHPRKCLPKDEQRRFIHLRDSVHLRTPAPKGGCNDGSDGRDPLYACYTCYRMLPAGAFGDRMRKRKDHKHGQELSRRAARFCWDCARRERLYGHLVPVKKAGEVWRLCHKCGLFRKAGRQCEDVLIPDDEAGELTTVTLCWTGPPPKPQPRPLAPLEALPRDLLRRVAAHLDYGSALALNNASAHLRHAVRPASWTALHEKFRWIRDRWTARREALLRQRHRGGGPAELGAHTAVPCYACFRVRPVRCFTPHQLALSDGQPDTYWKRRCGTCVVRLHATPNGKELRRWRQRRLCEACGLLRMAGRPCGGCAETGAPGGGLATVAAERDAKFEAAEAAMRDLVRLFPSVPGFELPLPPMPPPLPPPVDVWAGWRAPLRRPRPVIQVRVWEGGMVGRDWAASVRAERLAQERWLAMAGGDNAGSGAATAAGRAAEALQQQRASPAERALEGVLAGRAVAGANAAPAPAQELDSDADSSAGGSGPGPHRSMRRVTRFFRRFVHRSAGAGDGAGAGASAGVVA